MFIIASETSFKDGMITKVSIYGTSYYEILLINKREHAIHTHNNFGVCTDNWVAWKSIGDCTFKTVLTLERTKTDRDVREPSLALKGNT